MEKKRTFTKLVLETVVGGCAIMGAIWCVSAVCGVCFRILGV